ncbi:MAG: D-2-hydroxyacid dehydrogenase [Acidisphaera sp.]|nr:D-2-hydroxyacid dehydrogenase [Acidisphaera sp.]
MRIHVQNDPHDRPFGITPEQWQAAAARAPDVGQDHVVSYGRTPEEFAAALAEAEILVIAVSELAGRFPMAAPRLKVIFCTSAGVDKLAPFDWLPPGVALLNNRGVHAAKAGEFGIMAVLMLAARMPELIAAQRAERWQKLHSGSVRGRRLTVVGLGSLGGAAATQAAHFGIEVTGVRTRPSPHPACTRVIAVDDLDSVLPDSEFLLLACPLTEATRNLMDRRRLSLLPEGAGVVNIGRGPLLDQEAICDLLDAGKLGGAVLDVFTPEPVPPGHRLWTTKNLVMTPHVSADDVATYNPLSLDLLFINLRAMKEGKPLPNQVDPQRGY